MPGGITSGTTLAERNDPHATMVLRSPSMSVQNQLVCSCEITGGGRTAGGGAGAGAPETGLQVIAGTTTFMGIALRDINTDLYVASAARATSSHFGMKVEVSATGLSQRTQYTLDLIDALQGSWAWMHVQSCACTL